MQVIVSLQADLSWLQKEKAMRQIISKEAANIFILLKKKKKKKRWKKKKEGQMNYIPLYVLCKCLHFPSRQ